MILVDGTGQTYAPVEQTIASCNKQAAQFHSKKKYSKGRKRTAKIHNRANLATLICPLNHQMLTKLYKLIFPQREPILAKRYLPQTAALPKIHLSPVCTMKTAAMLHL